MPSLGKIRQRCVLTVRWERNSRSPICRLVGPAAASSAISSAQVSMRAARRGAPHRISRPDCSRACSRSPAQRTEAEYDQSFAVNAKIPYFLMREAAAQMADHGRIINMVTTQVAVTAATYSAYAGSKAPVEYFTKAFAKEIGGHGVTVNGIAPGPQKTSFFFNAETPETIAWLSGMTITGELGDPRDIVPVMRFLAAPETRWVTAQTVYVNGGMISPIN
jgi:NAD(P)-dependent dehydrogenase (short-subunit alcohol dehydrogenase family)